MPDQATILRGIVDRQDPRAELAIPVSGSRRARTIAFTSGKGGVGKSNLALNLGIALAQHGHSVCLLDACLGLGSLDLLCGLNGYWNLSHVMTAARSLDDIMLNGPEGIRMIPGGSSLTELAECPEGFQRELSRQLTNLERTHDFLIIDASTGTHRIIRQFVTAADQILVVTIPESTAIADAYATIKALSGATSPSVDLVINQTRSTQQARVIASRLQQTSRVFLRREIGFAGCVSYDPAVIDAVAHRKPFAVASPNCPAATDIHQLARRVASNGGATQIDRSYFDSFCGGQRRAA